MMKPTHLENIRKRILNHKKGDVFIGSDFFDIVDSKMVKMCLSRLEKEKFIRRIMRGVYEYPEYNDFLNEYVAPSPDKVANAIARNFGWTIVPCGDTALNLLGLSTQVPAVWSYVNDGAYKEYGYDKVVIKFRKTTNKEISKISYKTALVIQALKALGKENVSKTITDKISGSLSKEEKEVMLAEAKSATAWIYETIKSICK